MTVHSYRQPPYTIICSDWLACLFLLLFLLELNKLVKKLDTRYQKSLKNKATNFFAKSKVPSTVSSYLLLLLLNGLLVQSHQGFSEYVVTHASFRIQMKFLIQDVWIHSSYVYEVLQYGFPILFDLTQNIIILWVGQIDQQHPYNDCNWKPLRNGDLLFLCIYLLHSW